MENQHDENTMRRGQPARRFQNDYNKENHNQPREYKVQQINCSEKIL